MEEPKMNTIIYKYIEPFNLKYKHRYVLLKNITVAMLYIIFPNNCIDYGLQIIQGNLAIKTHQERQHLDKSNA